MDMEAAGTGIMILRRNQDTWIGISWEKFGGFGRMEGNNWQVI